MFKENVARKYERISEAIKLYPYGNLEVAAVRDANVHMRAELLRQAVEASDADSRRCDNAEVKAKRLRVTGIGGPIHYQQILQGLMNEVGAVVLSVVDGQRLLSKVIEELF